MEDVLTAVERDGIYGYMESRNDALYRRTSKFTDVRSMKCALLLHCVDALLNKN